MHREAEQYCPLCGREAADPRLKRFGEYFCSEAHVAEYAREIRTRGGQQAAAMTQMQAGQPETGETASAKPGGLRNLLKLGACCAAPILALLILVPLLRGGTGGLAAVGGSLLYFAALLACPLGMYFMMRSMSKMQQDGKDEGQERSGDPKALPPGRANSQTRRAPGE